MKSLFLLFIIVSASSAHAGWRHLETAGVKYWLYVPKSAGLSNAFMLNLHGCQQQAVDLQRFGNWKDAAEKYRMLVAIPEVPDGGVGIGDIKLGCWDTYGKDQGNFKKHSPKLIALTQALIANTKLRIDRSRIFVSGLSSGATQSLVLGCLRPDIFSGVGVNSATAAGSEVIEALSTPSITPAEIKSFCFSLAGNRAPAFARQKISFLHGDLDFIVNPDHVVYNTSAFTYLYKTPTRKPLNRSVLLGPNRHVEGHIYYDSKGRERISLIFNTGLGHNWASGSYYDNGGNFINSNSINYPDYLVQFLMGR